MDTIRREDLTAESAGINPEGQELAYEQGDLLDEYVGEHSMKMLTSVMDIIVEDALKRGISQKGILAFSNGTSIRCGDTLTCMTINPVVK